MNTDVDHPEFSEQLSASTAALDDLAPSAASPGRRLAAIVIDTAIYALVFGALSFAFGVNLFAEWGLIVSTVTFWGSVSLLQAFTRRTPGKAMLGLRVESLDGRRLGTGLVLLRNTWILAGLIPVLGTALEAVLGVIIFASLFFGDPSQGVHDRIADSRVVKLRRVEQRVGDLV